jgi:thymidylate kinase
MGKLIVITGLDGSGTTTITKKLHELDKKSFFIQSPHDNYSNCRKIIDTEVKKVSEIAHYYFYLSNNIYISEKIKTIKEKYPEYNIYCTRYLLDTVVSHKVQNVNVELEYQNGIYKIIEPDFTFFLKLDENIRQKRIQNRNYEKSNLDKIIDDSIIRERFIKEFSKYKNLIYIDASKTIEEICIDIKSIIERTKYE